MPSLLETLRFARSRLSALGVVVAWLISSPALAATSTIPGSPISITLFDTNGGLHQVAYNGVNQVYQGNATTPDSGITINLGGTRYGFTGAATNGIVGNQNLGITSQSALLGSGTGPSPWQVVTNFTAGANTTVKQTVSYVNGQNFLLFNWDITSTVNQAGVNFFHGADMFTFNNDNSLSGYSSVCNSIHSYNTVGGVSLYQEFVGLTAPSAYQGSSYNTIWSTMKSGTLNNTNNSTVIDNGIALQWNVDLTANVTKTIQQKWAFGSSPCSTTVLASLSGTVYGDANHNAALDGAETGTGVTGLYAKIIPNGGTSALEATPVNAATGAYQFAAVPPGTFSVIVDNNNTLTDLIPYLPPGFVGTEAPTQTRPVVVSTGNIVGIHFGLYAGSLITGTVFRDNAQGSGTANDALRNGLESTLGGITVSVTDSSATPVTITSMVTDGSGAFQLWVPTGSPSSLFVRVGAGGFFSTGNNLNGALVVLATSTSDVNAARRAWSFSAGQTVLGYNFGLVPQSSFTPNQTVSGLSPGTVAFTHTFRPGTLGTANLSITVPAGYSARAYQDANCDGTIQPGERTTAVTSITVSATWPRETDGQLKSCALEVVVSIPSGRAADDTATIVPSLSLLWSGPSVTDPNSVTDTINLSPAGQLNLSKQVRNVTTSGAFSSSSTGKPLDVLEYCIGFSALGGAVTNLIVRDPVPFFTDFVPGTITLTIGTVTTPVTDAVGYNATSRAVVVNVGSVAAGVTGQVCYRAQIR
jgi:hypothetical protein